MSTTCSVLLPLRSRVHTALRAVHSVLDHCSDNAKVEILVRMDDDDPCLTSAYTLLAPFVKLIVGPRGRGYLDLPKMYDELVRASSGEWLWLFNDDALVHTPNWDEELRRAGAASGPLLVKPRDTNPERYRSPMAELPFVRAQPHRRLGRLSLSTSNDTWLHEVYTYMNAVAVADVMVSHFVVHSKLDSPYSRTGEETGTMSKEHHALMSTGEHIREAERLKAAWNELASN